MEFRILTGNPLICDICHLARLRHDFYSNSIHDKNLPQNKNDFKILERILNSPLE